MYIVRKGACCVYSMAIHRSLPQTLQLLILGVLNFDAVANPTFVSEPSDYTQIFPHGSSHSLTVTLNCAVRYLEAGQSVAWYKNGVPISNNGTVYSNNVDTERYTVNMYMSASVLQSSASFDLQIKTYTTSANTDSGNYQCVVITVPNVESRTARLNVFVTPESGYLRCAIGDDSDDDVFDVKTGIPILLACRSDPTGVPEMTTYWTREGSQGETLETVTGTDTRDDSRVLYFYWTPTNQQNQATFVCTGFHPGYTTNRTCQLGPFNVQYKPIVQISPSSHTVTIETQEVNFTCITDANPPVTRYVWSNTAGEKFSLEGANVLSGSDGKWIHMRNFESQDNGEYDVTCYAKNDIGPSMVAAVATLNINIQSTTTVTEHSSTALSTPTTSKHEGNKPSTVQHGMTSVTVISTGTSIIYDISKTDKTSQVNTTAIIGGTVGGCGFILILFGVILTAVCVCKSRRKSQNKESLDTHTVLNPNDEVANVNSVDISQSPYSTVNDAYDTENNAGGTTNADSTSVEITLQARVFFKKPDRNKEDTGQSMIEPELFTVEKQGTSLSKTTTEKNNFEKTETGNDFLTDNDDRKQELQTLRHRPMILPKPKQHLQSAERLPCQTNESGYNKTVLTEEIATTGGNGQSSDDQSDQKKDTDISAMYASVDLSKKGKSKGLDEHSNVEENIEICDVYHEETVGQQTSCTDESAQHKNVEGLTYAELDLSSTMPRLSTRRSSMKTKQIDDTVYAEVRV